MTPVPSSVSASKGEHTHSRIVERAMIMASSVGLEGLTIGALATELGLSKSGLFAHFRSKERLQLDVLDAAAEHFRGKVFLPALTVARGRPRLEMVFENWLRWISAEELPGGCILLAAALEWDGRRGRVRDRLVSWFDALDQGLGRAVRLGIEEGHFRADLDPAQFAYETHGIAMKYHLDARLLESQCAGQRARTAFQRLLADAAATGAPSSGMP